MLMGNIRYCDFWLARCSKITTEKEKLNSVIIMGKSVSYSIQLLLTYSEGIFPQTKQDV